MCWKGERTRERRERREKAGEIRALRIMNRTALVQNQMYEYYSIPLLATFTENKTHTYGDTNVTMSTRY